MVMAVGRAMCLSLSHLSYELTLVAHQVVCFLISVETKSLTYLDESLG